MMRFIMKTVVSENGLQIPKKMLKGMSKVEIHREKNKIVISPIIEDDPIFELGRRPIKSSIKDGSSNHDKYIG